MIEYTPPGYRIEDDRVVNIKTQEYFLIRNRGLKEIDQRFRGNIKKLTEKLVGLSPNGHIKVLDVGGGRDSRAATELSGPKITVFNCDILAKPHTKTPNMFPVPSDAFRMPYAKNSFDLIYSRQFLVYLSDFRDQTREQAAWDEITRVLKPGGVAVLDDDYYAHEGHPFLILELENKLKSKISKKEGGLYLNFWERIHKFVEPGDYAPGNFLILQKFPLNPEINKTVEGISNRLRRWE